MSKRVIMLTHQCAERGGSFMRAVSLARPLVGMGFDMTVVASRSGPGVRLRRSQWHGVHLIEMPDVLPWRIRNAGLSPMDLLGRLLYTRRGFDLFHTLEQRPCASLPALWRAHPAIPWVSDWADLWGAGGLSSYRTGSFDRLLGRFDSWMEPYIRTRCDAVTAISRYLRARAMQLGVPPERAIIVPVGASFDLLHPMDKAVARRHFGIPDDADVLVSSGFSWLDAELLAAAFLELRKLRPHVRLLMTGGHIPAFEQRIRAADAEQSIIHLGILPYDRLAEALACGDIMWIPYSSSDANAARFPNRLGEAVSVGRPIATNPGGDHAQLIEQENIGIVTPTDASATAQGIARLLDNPATRAQMGSRARELAATRLSWASIACTVAELYSQLL